jgi:hypothetical protein
VTLLDRLRRIAAPGPCAHDHTRPYTVDHDTEGWPILVHACGCTEGYVYGWAPRIYGTGEFVDPCSLPDEPEWTSPRADQSRCKSMRGSGSA